VRSSEATRGKRLCSKVRHRFALPGWQKEGTRRKLDQFQFERHGYFIVDHVDSTTGKRHGRPRWPLETRQPECCSAGRERPSRQGVFSCGTLIADLRQAIFLLTHAFILPSSQQRALARTLYSGGSRPAAWRSLRDWKADPRASNSQSALAAETARAVLREFRPACRCR
jgi:hypothetical protein